MGQTLAEGFYDPPPNFVKPKSYPGLSSSEGKHALTQFGVVNLELINPGMKGLKGNRKVRAAILRGVVTVLTDPSEPGEAYIRDPEAVLPKLYTGLVKDGLKAHVEEALEAMYDQKVPVKVTAKKPKGVAGWEIQAPALIQKKLVPGV